MPPEVSRETWDKFELYLNLLRDWQTRMNLVAPSTLPDAMRRHIDDSAQLVDLLAETGTLPARPTWIDLGSGAGFPGLVIALITDVDMHLVESRRKKCLFLEAVRDRLDLQARVTIHNRRAEDMTGPAADYISARAFAPLPKLFDWGLPFAAQDTLWLLPKGRGVDVEIEAAKRDFAFDLSRHASRTDPEASILEIAHVRRRIGRQKGQGPSRKPAHSRSTAS
ncbi:MAG: 16S rRNA (guanine(527)-N(7))-methyltransferase RsmG [Pseudomonadota bacterium]